MKYIAKIIFSCYNRFMKLLLDLNTPPHYYSSNSRQFLPHERHITRTFSKDVLILMYKGILRFEEDGVPVELKAGEYYIQLAGHRQEGLEESNSPNYYYIHFQGTFRENGQLPHRGTFDIQKISLLTDALERLGIDAFQTEYRQYFYAILSALYHQGHTNSDAEKIREYLVQHYERPISSKDLEKVVFLTQNQIINIFKEQYGVTPHKYLMLYRLDRACELLLSTSRSVYTIALSVGFGEYSSFFRAFKAKYGTTPIEFRNLSEKATFIRGAKSMPTPKF